MLNVKLLALAASTFVTLGGLAGTQATQEDTVRRTLQWPAGSASQVFELSNLHGSVHIVAESRSDVSVVATRTVQRQRGSDPGPALDFRSQNERLLVCGDVTHCGCNVEWPRDRGDEDRRTRIRVDFEVRVPKGVTLDVCAVNGGTLRVEGVDGRYTLRNVNGSLQLLGARGAGRASTVNGSIEATFVAPPNASAEFRTVNGRVDVTMPASLSADLRMKTMNGGLYTDFETTPLASQAAAERRNGKFVYRADRFASVRVGKGGPELTFETLNGDIQVRKR